VKLRMRREQVAVRSVEPQLRDAQFTMSPGVDRLHRSDGLSDREKVRRKRRLEGENLLFAIAVVGAELDAIAETPEVLREN